MFWPKALTIMILFRSLTCLAIGEGAAPLPSEANDKPYSGHQTEEWLQVQNQLTNLKGRVENQKKLVENLIWQKEHTKGAQQIEKMDELVKAHAEWARLVEAFNQLNTTFQTKFPEKGGALGRVYKRMEPSRTEALENKITLEDRIGKLNNTIKKQYSKKNPSPKEKSSVEVLPKKINKKESLKSDTDLENKVQDVPVTDQIILQK